MKTQMSTDALSKLVFPFLCVVDFAETSKSGKELRASNLLNFFLTVASRGH